MSVLGKLLLIGGVGLTVWAGFESMLLCYGTSQPQELALRELGRAGAVQNVHVTVSEFVPAEEFLIEESEGHWTRVWVPLFTPDGQWTERPVVAYVTGKQNEAQVAAALAGPQVTGVVTNGLQNLGSNQQKLLAPRYPNVDLTSAIALHIGRRFPNPLLTLPLLVLGIGLLAGGGYLTFRR